MARDVRKVEDFQIGQILYIEAQSNSIFSTGAYLVDDISPPNMIALRHYLPELETDVPVRIYNLEGMFDRPSTHPQFGRVQVMDISSATAATTDFVMG